jgi:hypothetical protein
MLRIVLWSVPFIALAVFIPSVPAPWKDLFEYVIVAGLSGLVAYGELVSRYKDDPRRLLAAGPTPSYILVNIAAGIAAVILVRYTGVLKNTHPLRLYEILLASFGAVAFFRTSLFTARVGSTDIGIGPSVVLQSLLAAADRMIDRDQAEGRAEDVANIMQRVDFAKAQLALPALCFTLVQNITPEEQKAAAEQIKEIGGAAGIADNAKAIILGVYLIRLVGADVLKRSVKALGSNIEPGTGPAPNPQALAPAAQVPGPAGVWSRTSCAATRAGQARTFRPGQALSAQPHQTSRVQGAPHEHTLPDSASLRFLLHRGHRPYIDTGPALHCDDAVTWSRLSVHPRCRSTRAWTGGRPGIYSFSPRVPPS